MTIFCGLCGDGWERDPALEVRCPTCFRAPGRRCVRPSGHECKIHADRDQLAMDEGWLKPCAGVVRPVQLPRQALHRGQPGAPQLSLS